jgi:hypothetical protein
VRVGSGQEGEEIDPVQEGRAADPKWEGGSIQTVDILVTREVDRSRADKSKIRLSKVTALRSVET